MCLETIIGARKIKPFLLNPNQNRKNKIKGKMEIQREQSDKHIVTQKTSF